MLPPPSESKTFGIPALVGRSTAETFPHSSPSDQSQFPLSATLNELAIIDYATERFDEARAQYLEAIEWQRKALEANPANSQYRQFLINHLNNLIKVTSRMGDSEGLAEAERQLESLQGLNPVVLALDAQLGAIIKGDQLPEDEARRLLLTDRAYHTALSATALSVTAVRLWGAALADNPKLADDRQMQHRYNAACAASLAAGGAGAKTNHLSTKTPRLGSANKLSSG